jgi:hypothetical protein
MTLKSKGATAIDPGEKLYIYIYIKEKISMNKNPIAKC